MKYSLVLVIAICLLTLGCQHKIQPDLASKVTGGEFIEAVDLRGNFQTTIQTMRPGIHSRAGDRISLPVIKSDIEFLYSLGFEEVRVEEEPRRIGKIIVFHVREKAPPQTLAP